MGSGKSKAKPLPPQQQQPPLSQQNQIRVEQPKVNPVQAQPTTTKYQPPPQVVEVKPVIENKPVQVLDPAKNPFVVHKFEKKEDENSDEDEISRPNEERVPDDVMETPNILFYFDLEAKMFYHYSTVSAEWNFNDLNNCMDSCPRCPLLKFKNPGEEAEAIQFAKYMSFIATSDKSILLVGGYNTFFSCIEYDISTNAFLARKPLKAFRNNPSLCRYKKYVYAVSGDLLDLYSKDVSRYDTEKDEWETMPDLLEPQGFGTSRIVYESRDAVNKYDKGMKEGDVHKDYDRTLKLVVLGGFSNKFPKTYVPKLSILSLLDKKWSYFDLSLTSTGKIPKLLSFGLVQRKNGDLIIFGCEGTKNVYELDLVKKKFKVCGRFPEEDPLNKPMWGKDAVHRNDLVFCLSHKSANVIYRGYLTFEKWEVL